MHRSHSIAYALFIALAWPMSAWAGFLEMPEITELPQLERKSLLKDLDIPGVQDRDPDPESGPRLNITRFKLEGIVEYPELGITSSDIEGLIEGIRFDLMDEFKVLESGFTEAELEDISKLVGEIEEETIGRHVTELEVQKLVWLIREQRQNRGVTLGQIEAVADRITRFYRERGFILAKAYIPQQEVRDGIVTLTLLLGALGEVEVSNSSVYDSTYLASSFDDLLARPVTSSVIEEKLYLVNDYPGVSVAGFFEPGAQVGDTKLNLNVNSERSYNANVRFDNHGSEQTGEYRFYSEVFWENPLGNADQLHLALLYTIEPDNSDFGQLRYSTRLFSPRFTVAAGASNNYFVLGPGSSESINNLQLFGETKQYDITLNYRFKRSRTSSYYGDLVLSKIESQLRIGAFLDNGDSGLDVTVNNTSLVFTYDVLNEASKVLHQGDIKFTSGEFEKGVEIGQDEKYQILNSHYSLLTFFELPSLGANTRVILRADLQYTDSALSSINQFSLAGPTRVRAYPNSQFASDFGFYAGLDWVFNAPAFLDVAFAGSNLQQILQPFVFLDVAQGETVALLQGVDGVTGKLIGAGIGVQFSYQNQFRGNFQLAFPIEDSFSSTSITVPEDSSRLVFDFQYSFR
jgi:hemolysin activation/secretion protein